jgi:predicted nucleotidyltransferase component of viral defense system
MILQNEILKISEQEGVPPDTIDKNYVLGHFLAGLFRQEWAQQNLMFKGGTCLKKCYFKDYRFSEDLDFTLVNPGFEVTDKLIRTVCQSITDATGILLVPEKIMPIISENRTCGCKIFVAFWGANHKRNQIPPTPKRWLTKIKIEIVSFEKVLDMPDYRELLDDFSDSNLFAGLKIPCYSISEIIAEKFRALLQRSYSAPRDYYDLWNILCTMPVEEEKAILFFKEKRIFKGLVWSGYEDFFNESRLKSMRREWNNSLSGHIKDGELPDVETVLIELKRICEKFEWV